ncbi:hypothetical protein RCO27_18980 [Sphingosinicella sp. LHD-64]|uniref:hypothetical protein n=1 Tax=Sphingosinicella sp. LHD-64 TaxID=3072139 RepID=UPI00280FA774|nr:hypothetical protein [Sphingosinicella sp. LHD-64]MDQ8758318.1 hypothetical protein [Sphingosinicella sp. LHD-64]
MDEQTPFPAGESDPAPAPERTAPPADPRHPDPEIAALLDFAPVRRRCRRHDGWSEQVQRDFIVALATHGNSERAAQAVGRTMSGAYKVRTSAGGEGFGEAWDKAVALYLQRHPAEPRTGRWRPADGKAPPPPEPEPEPEPESDPSLCPDGRTKAEVFESILQKYWRKVAAEREARLEGRITEADFYVRQLTVIEIALDLGGYARDLLGELERRGLNVFRIAATPMSVLLDRVRLECWAEMGEPERPPLSPLGEHDDEVATGVPTSYFPLRDGDHEGWQQRQDAQHARAAQAQTAWEEKARADAAAWAAREGAAEGTRP